MKKCCVIGLGYIGLPTSTIIASSNYKVVGYDINPTIINTIKKGKAHFNEKNLNQLLKQVIDSKKLSASQFIESAEIFIITVPTPLDKKINSNIPKPDISFVLDAAKKIAEVLKAEDLVIIESTCPVGTTKKVQSLIEKYSGIKKEDFYLACCPERVIPGNILNEIKFNDRVIGGVNKKSSEKARDFYSNFCLGKLLITDSKTAELVKLTENSYRDVNIAFANELSMICEKLEIDCKKLINIANHHPRVNILNPGCGVGGHCIAVDPWFIASELPKQTQLIQTSRKVNNEKSNWVFKKIKKEIKLLEKKNKSKINVGCLGLTYKPDADDLRESPALNITNKLISEGFQILCCEPHIKSYQKINLVDINYINKNADIIFILVAHSIFKSTNFKNKRVFDFCYALNND